MSGIGGSKRRTKIVERKRSEVRIKTEDEQKFRPMSSRTARPRSKSPYLDRDNERRSRSPSMERKRVFNRSSRSSDRSSELRKRRRSRSNDRQTSRNSSEERIIDMDSNEREDGRVVVATRERSISPYTLAMDRWSNFKSMEGKLMEYAKERLAKYDASPEEHPQYAEEWKKFWTLRYTEVKNSGRNPDDHDYLAEWVPYWSHKSREMLDEEVKRRRAELLKKFRLDSDRIPIRSDFEKNAPAKAVKIPEPPNFGKSTAAAPPPPISNPASAVEGVSNMWHKLTSDTIKLPSPASIPQHRAPEVPQPKPKLVPTLRLIGAFHDYLGALGDPLDDLLSKAVSLEKSYEGASRILVEDREVLATLENVRIRLIARKNDGSIDPALFGSLDNCLQNLNRLLSVPVQPSQLQAAGQPLPGGGLSLPGAGHHVSGAGHSYPEVGQQPVVGSGQQVTRMEEGGFSSQFGLTEKLDDLDEIEMIHKSSAAAAPPPRKTLSELLTTEEQLKRFLCESIAVVLLQTDHCNYTKQGLYDLMSELMKRIETSEEDPRILDLAKQFNAQHLVKAAIQDPGSVSMENSAMDLLKFTPEELVCLLKNFDTLSQEERKCFQYYMSSLQLKRSSLTSVELNILDLYLLKTREIEMMNEMMMGAPTMNSNNNGDDFFKPKSFDYGHTVTAGYSDGGQRSERNMRRNDWSEDLAPRRSRQRRPKRGREGSPEKERNEREKRRSSGRSNRDARDVENEKALNEELDRLADERRKRKRGSQVEPDSSSTVGSSKQRKEEPPVEKVQAPLDTSNLNPDGSENLGLKYDNELINSWVRRGEEKKALFLEEDNNGTLTFKCTVCGATLFGLRNVVVHYEGKKHKARLEEEEWTTYDPLQKEAESSDTTQNQIPNQLDKEMEEFEAQLQNLEEDEVIMLD